MNFILDLIAWPVRAGATAVIAMLEELEGDILDLWAEWGDA